jgi:thiol-disulfide isomerase/thioredoxin
MKTRVLFALLLFVSSCEQKPSEVCRVVVRMSGTSADSVVLRRISLSNGPARKIDSGLLRFSRDSLVFELPLSSDSLYQFSLKFSNNNIYCIPDAPELVILMNKKTGKNFITGSPASESLLRFNEEQDSLIHLMQTLRSDQNPLSESFNPGRKDSIQTAITAMNKRIQQRYYDFADTVSSSAAFMENFDHIDFQDDYNLMKKLMTKTMIRFPNSEAISRLNNQVLKLIHIRDTELQPGDIFPELQLPDTEGHVFSTNSTKGKYVFVDFWSTWCQNCIAYDKVRHDIGKEKRLENLVLIHIALDDHIKLWRGIVESNKLPGIQLIDKDMWQGQTSEKLAFDSIPFNFLIGPDQHILAKAIPADSVLPVLKKYIR